MQMAAFGGQGMTYWHSGDLSGTTVKLQAIISWQQDQVLLLLHQLKQQQASRQSTKQ